MKGDRTKTTTGVLLAVVLLLLVVEETKGDDYSTRLQPFVRPSNNTNFVVGYNFTLICRIPEEGKRLFTWVTPNKHNEPLVVTKVQNVSGEVYQTSRLTIRNATLADSGQYICNVWVGEHVNSSYPYEVEVRETMESYVTLEPATTELTVDEGLEVSWIVSVSAFPPDPRLLFQDPSGKDIEASEKMWTEVSPDKNEVVLRLKNTSRIDAGSYTVEAKTQDGNASANATLQLRIRHAPLVNVPTMAIVPVRDTKRLECRVVGYPLPRVMWKYHPCPSVQEGCQKDFEEVEVMREEVSESELVTWKEWKDQRPGILKCEAKNFLGTNVAETRIIVSDIGDSFTFRHIDNKNLSTVIVNEKELEVTEGDGIRLECGAVKALYSGVTLDSPRGTSLQFMSSNTSLTWMMTNERRSVTLGDEGSYVCRAAVNSSSNLKNISTLHLKVRHGTDALPKQHTVVLEENTPRYTIHCRTKGNPPPRITWTKNGLLLAANNETSSPGIRKGGHELFFNPVVHNDSGLYECHVQNRVGVVSASVTIKVMKSLNKTGNSEGLKDTQNFFLPEGKTNVTLECRVKVTPPPQIVWTKDGITINSSSSIDPRISEDGLRIIFPEITLSDTGIYKCENQSLPRAVIDVFNIEVSPRHTWSYRFCGIFIIVVLLFLFVVSMISQYCNNKGIYCHALDGSNPYTIMDDSQSRRNTQHTGGTS
ncbi:vascular endothelial growth factor receptor 1-like isoform X2 [Oratosquilla oratoria]|uniref:vascular endothelial growth factor receptor 1-like isoform X2 n=1 Tax=Oratosquilla oratoria TaxID=337810 RepID=UPI003F764582